MRDGHQIFDVHTHIGEWGTWELKGHNVSPFPAPLTSKTELREHMDRWGIDKQIVMTHYHPDLSVTFDRNTLALELAELDGVYAGIFFNPDYPEQTRGALELAESENVKVLKTSADTWNTNYDPDTWNTDTTELMDEVVRHAKQHDLVFQFHTGSDKSDPRNAFAFIDRYPDATYHLVHMGGTAGGHFALVPRLLDNLDRAIYVDTSWSRGFAPRWLADELKQRNALDRLMFATDYPWGDIPGEYHKLRGLTQLDDPVLTEDELAQVLYGNAARLYLDG